MVLELVVEAAVAALMSAMANDVWPKARERMARALRPGDPAGESAELEKLVKTSDEVGQRDGLKTHLMRMLRQHPERVDDVHFEVGQVEQLLIEAALVQVAAQTVHVYGQEARPSEAARLAFMQAGKAAHELEEMTEGGAILLLAAMPVSDAARRLALMNNAAELLSNMDDRLAAHLLSEMSPPGPAQLLSRVEAERGWVILAELANIDKDVALQRLSELTELDPGRAALLLFQMGPSVAAQLLSTLSPPHPAELFSRMGPDRAGAVLAAMTAEKAVWRLSEMTSERAAMVLSKMDRVVAVGLFGELRPSSSTDLLVRMASGDSAEVLAKMDQTWAGERLSEMAAQRALEILVALRPPRNLVKELDVELAGRLLPVAVTALARWAENAQLVEAAETYADRIRAEAEAEVNRRLTDVETEINRRLATADMVRPAPQIAAPPPTLAEKIMLSLGKKSRQTLSNLSRNLRVSESDLRPEIGRLIARGIVIEGGGARSAAAHYSVRDQR